MLGNGSELYFRIQEEQNLSFLNYETIVIGDYIIGNIYGKTIDNSIILLELFHKVNEMEQYISKDLFIKCQKSIAAYYLSGLENTVQMIDTLLACFNSNITLKDFFKLIEKVSDTELKNVCREVINNKNYIIDVWED
ncbi:MAG: hypothetical protein HFH74_16595 [Lachnospiraceae bacterium]|jgi:predicted Zn-dependent peptidase|nr:hypothetical protein [Lachnospiraceae bacterium]